mmetsp:Transcript_3110/g.3474  ORF Transcript_3110/g.3474 Transcript_3110/m.3474 type:complete len:388 (-) Transcript_3110:261-1424(-)
MSVDSGTSFTEYCNVDPGTRSKALEYPTSIQISQHIFTVFSADHYTGIKLSRTRLPEIIIGHTMHHKEDPAQRAALIDFAGALNYKNWIKSDHWTSDKKSYCEWFGIKCKGSDVVELSLPGNNLNGHIPPSVAALKHLKVFDIHGSRPDDYRGCKDSNLNMSPLPEELYSLTELQKIDIEYTCAAGPISRSIGGLKNLVEVHFHGNFLNGTIPLEMNECVELQEFKLGRNPLTGPFPNVPKLHKLTKFNCNFCALTGPIPDIFGNFPDLVQTFWDGNGLTGTLPASLGRLTKLQRLSFNINNLSGEVPEELCNAPALTDCRIGADTNLTAYEANYPWIPVSHGNMYKCPLPKCATGTGVCNKLTKCHPVVNPCSPVKCETESNSIVL